MPVLSRMREEPIKLYVRSIMINQALNFKNNAVYQAYGY